MLFWEKYILITNDTFDDEYELDELLTLYKNSEQNNILISDVNMIKMINHYFSPQVEIIDNKYITNIKCILWSKHDDIYDYLLYYKKASNNVKQELISFDELYQGYKNYYKSKSIIEQKSLPIVSKQFFEKYLTNQLTNYIQFDKFVSSEWLQG